MKKILYKLARIIFKYQGYRIVLIKASKGNIIVDGDKELLEHVNIKGYFGIDKIVKPIATKENYKGPVALGDTIDLETQITEDIIQTLRDIDNEVEYHKSVERYNNSVERLKRLTNLKDKQEGLIEEIYKHNEEQQDKEILNLEPYQGVLILKRENLNKQGSIKDIKDIDYYDFKVTAASIYKSDVIVFLDDNGDSKLLKNRYGEINEPLNHYVPMTLAYMDHTNSGTIPVEELNNILTELHNKKIKI